MGDMKVGLTSNLHKLLLMVRPVEAFRQCSSTDATNDEMPVWLPLPTCVERVSNIFDVQNEDVPFPSCQKEDLVTLRRELHEMKVDFASKLNNLNQVLSSGEALHQSSSTVDNMPVWMPLPNSGEQPKSLAL